MSYTDGLLERIDELEDGIFYLASKVETLSNYLAQNFSDHIGKDTLDTDSTIECAIMLLQQLELMMPG